VTQTIEVLHGKEIDAVMADDAAWFEEHPGRQLRLRKPVKYEFEPMPDPGPDEYVLVLQLKPGLRLRQTFHATARSHQQWTARPEFMTEAPEWGLERLFAQIASAEAVALRANFLAKRGTV
jgi:hypothetical protein